MKSVVRIERQAKVKDVRASVAGLGLPTEEIDTRVALIQAMIPLGQSARRWTSK
jgi:hypothetical protein